MGIDYGDDKFKNRINADGSQESIRDRRFKLLKVDHNDISKYWCEVKPGESFKENQKSELKIEGLKDFIFFSDFFS